MQKYAAIFNICAFWLCIIAYSNADQLIEQKIAPIEYKGCDDLSCYTDSNGNIIEEDRAIKMRDPENIKYTKDFKYHNDIELKDQLYVGQTQNQLPKAPFGMSINGKEVATGRHINPERINDLKLLEHSITTRFNSMVKDKILGAQVFRESNFGKDVAIVPYANYPHFIEKAELLLYKTDAVAGDEPVAQVTIAVLGEEIYIDEDFFSYHLADELDAVLKVYDAKGNFDTTSKVRLSQATEAKRAHASENKNYLLISNIPVKGGTVTISGQDLSKDASIKVLGHKVPIDHSGNFVAEFVMPNGKNKVELDYAPNDYARPINYSREITIKDYDFFFIGVGDFTIGNNQISAPTGVDPEKFRDEDGFFDEGRLAFFLKGKIKGEYLLTARADTGRQEFKNLLKGLDDENDELYRRIDSDKYYSVFSDNSTVKDEHASQGRLYVKLERDDSYAMWGSYKAEIRTTDLNQVRRTLYGAKVKWVAKKHTKYGEPMRELIVFGASPETIPVTDEFRGTGGSIYYLNYRDMLLGSEKIRVETRDRNSDLVLNTKFLRYGYDYDIDYDSGRVLLNEPLEGAVDDGDVIRSENEEWGDPVYLVVSYEAKSTLNNMKDANVVGAASQFWLNDHIKVGATAVHEDITGMADNTMYGLDTMIRKSPKTYVKASYTLTEGTNIERNTSFDGGLSSTTQDKFTTSTEKYGVDVEVAADLAELNDKINGKFKGYYRDLESGFTGITQATQSDLTQYGASINISPTDYFRIRAEYDHKDNSKGKYDRYLSELTISPRKFLDITAGLTYQDQFNDNTSTDIGLRVKYKFGDHYKNNVYIFGQDVINNGNGSSRNYGRYGVGTSIAFTDKIKLGGEAAMTDEGNFRGKLKGTYTKDNKNTYYIGYQVDTDRILDQDGYQSDRMKGAMVMGGRTKYNDGLSFSAEEKYHHGHKHVGHTNNFGLQFTPYQDWKFGTTFEYGNVGPIKRLATTASANYGKKERNLKTSIEYRKEEDNRKADNINDRRVYTWRISAQEQINDDLSLLGKANLAYSDGNITNAKRGNFAEASFGLAYRPIEKVKKLNLLAKYNFYYDFPTTVQSLKSAANTRQRTHVFSLDGNYDLNNALTLGFKYGYRRRQEKIIDLNEEWMHSIAHLALLRLDLHITHRWDLFLEGRELYSSTVKTSQIGALSGVYRHFGDNVKLGGGYSWSEFDEDLTNMNYKKQGWFINLISKF